MVRFTTLSGLNAHVAKTRYPQLLIISARARMEDVEECNEWGAEPHIRHARGEFVGENRGRGHEYKTERTVWKMRENQRKSGKIPDFTAKLLGNQPPDACAVRLPSDPPKNRQVFLADFFIHCESNGISSRFSMYIIAVGVSPQPKVVSLSQ